METRYNDISSFCHEYEEPVFLTKEGEGDLAVMSLEKYNDTVGRLELYAALMAGLRQFETGETESGPDVMKKIRQMAQGNF
jgi:PHD/YefM family antitoxin component YafN of YafNO toxin-antitoxin module